MPVPYFRTINALRKKSHGVDPEVDNMRQKLRACEEEITELKLRYIKVAGLHIFNFVCFKEIKKTIKSINQLVIRTFLQYYIL